MRLNQPLAASMTLALSLTPLAGASLGQSVVTLNPVDTGGLYVDLNTSPSPTVDDVVVRDSPFIYNRNTTQYNDLSVAVLEFDLSGVNPDGLFGTANLVGEIAANNSLDTGERLIRPIIIAGDGTVTAADGFRTPVQQFYFEDYISYSPPSDSSVAFDLDVTSGFRELSASGQGLAAVFSASNLQAPSVTSGVTLVLNDYYADPFDAVPTITQNTGLAFAGQPGEFITDGTSELIEGDEINQVFVSRNFDNGISVRLNNFSLDFSAPGDAQLMSGDSFDATRWPFQEAGDAGFTFSGNYRTYNDSLASFTIDQVVYDGEGNVLVFDASFMQRGELGDPAAFGRVVYNIPEPTAVALLGLALPLLAGRRRG